MMEERLFDRVGELRAQRCKIDAEIAMLDGPREAPGAYGNNCTAPCNQAEHSPEEIIDHLFKHHPVESSEQELRHGMVRDAAKALAMAIWKACPYGADRTAAIRKVREAVMTANAAIALKGVSFS